MLDTLMLPFQFSFMNKAFIIVTLTSIPMAILSCYIVLKGWSLMGDAIAHAVLPGIVIAHLLAIPLAIGAFIAGLCCALTTGYIKENCRIREDTVMGIVFSGMFAVGIILFHQANSELHLTHVLLGDVLGISVSSVIETGMISVFVLLILLIRGRDLMLLIFDPQQAQVLGINVRFWHYGIQVLLALSIVAALQAVGMILSISLLITPGACALLVSKRFGDMVVVSLCVAISCSLLGVYTSFYLDSTPAATIVLLMAVVFCGIFCHKIYADRQAVKNQQEKTLDILSASPQNSATDRDLEKLPLSP